MKNSFNALKYDLLHGSLLRKRCYIFPILLAFLLSWSFSKQVEFVPEFENQTSFGDYFLYCFSGNHFRLDDFSIPYRWILLYGMSAFLSLVYPFEDLKGYGLQILMRMGKRKTWWRTKIAWLFFQSLFYYFLLLFGIAAFLLIRSISFDVVIHPDVIHHSTHFLPKNANLLIESWEVFLFPPLCMFLISSFQFGLQSKFSSVVSFIITSSLIAMTSVLQNDWYPLQIGMILRLDKLSEGGSHTTFILAIDLVIFFITIIVGSRWIGKKDILGGKHED